MLLRFVLRGAAVGAFVLGSVAFVGAQIPPGSTPKVPPGLEISRWAREPMLRSPVALSFDDQGHLYVVETARRSTVDIDIRGHPSWIVDDLANQSVDDLRRFFRARMSPENSLANASWLPDYNQDGLHDWRDLTEVKEKVHRLEDTRRNGRADRAQVFAEGFNEEINGVIAGVLPWEDDVFVTIYPDLWRLRDRDGDGVAEVRESLFRGFGVHAAFDGHDLHGLTIGPEGKIYFSIGDNGFSVTNREGHRLHHPNTGGVLRMNPDGSDLEVFARGLRNPQEIAFDEFGNLFTVDNDGDLADERERFVYITEGSDSGWRLHWQFREAGWAKYTRQPDYNPWIDEHLWVPQFPGQPAHITPPLTNYSVGPGSFKYNPGTALNEAYRGHFFLIQFPVAKVTAFQTRPKGAAFEMVHEHTLVSGMMASAVNFGPDGALYVGDWDGMWSPSGKGSIWKVDDPTAAKSARRTEVRERLHDGLRNSAAEELERLLGHDDQRLRLRSQFELVRRGEFERLRRVARAADAPRLARVHALWGLGQGRAIRAPEDVALADADPELRAQSAKVAGDVRALRCAPALQTLLRDPSPRVQFHAALALGKLGDATAIDGLVELLKSNDDADAFVRHAAVMGLVGCATEPQLVALSAQASSSVRVGAVVALRRRGAEGLTAFLADADPRVRREAIRAIHDDDSVPGALSALAALVSDPALRGEPGMMRRVLNANLRLGTEAAARRLVRFAAEGSESEALRLEALECLASWAPTAVPALDRVQGFVRPLGERVSDLGNRMIREHWSELTRGAGKAMLQTLARIVMENRIAVDSAVFADWAKAEEMPVTVRAQALELLARADPGRLPEVLPLAANAPQAELRLMALRLRAAHQPDVFVRGLVDGAAKQTLAERQLQYRLAGSQGTAQVGAWIEGQLDECLAGRLPVEVGLDLLEAARLRTEAGVKAKLAVMDALEPTTGAVAGRRWLLKGGDAARGQEIFRSHPNAQCVRCHEAGGEGHQVGPVLKGIASRVDREYLLESLLEPSARIADGFATTSVVLRNGDEVDGVRIGDSAEFLTLRLASGEVRRLPRAELKHQATSTVSAMPPMGEILTRFELRDLIEYLASLK